MDQLPSSLEGKKVRVYFCDDKTETFFLQGNVASATLNLIHLTAVVKRLNVHSAPTIDQPDQIINTMCNRFSRLEILDD